MIETQISPKAENLFWIDFKKITKEYPKELKLWMKFNNGREQTYADISFSNTITQMYFDKTPIKASLKHVWDNYHGIMDGKRITEPWRTARIYPGKSIGPKDFYVEYKSDGTVLYHNREGIEIPALRFNWESDKMQDYERKLELEMKFFLIKIKHDHIIKA